MNKLFSASAFATCILAGNGAHALIIDFNGHGDDFASTQFEAGFQFDFLAGGWGILTDGFDIGVPLVHNGTTRLAMSGNENGSPAYVVFAPVDGSQFNLSRVDSATFFAGTRGGIEVTGYLHGGGTVSTTFTTTDSFATYALPGTFANLDSVKVQNTVDGHTFEDSGVSLDNIDVTLVPEPASMISLALGGVLLLRKRRK